MNKDLAHKFKQYLQSQRNICQKSELYDDTLTHGSKIIMLFAEIFSFLVENYGIENTASMISNYSNTSTFKHWFWKIKHLLGEKLKSDPSFCDIGVWIGKGFFLKMCLSLMMHHKLYIEEPIISKMIEKQKKLLNGLLIDNGLGDGIKLIEFYNDHYSILNEKIILSNSNNCFYLENIIK